MARWSNIAEPGEGIVVAVAADRITVSGAFDGMTQLELSVGADVVVLSREQYEQLITIARTCECEC